jgi:putative thiamine transport system ATP-binding protein
LLELKNITLKWNSPNEKVFIKDLNLKIKNGEILCIFGASGVGKSSLINVIAGVYEDDLKFQGKIILNGKNLNQVPIEKRKIGLLLQDGTLFPHLTVKQNIFFGMSKKLTYKQKSALITNNLKKSNMVGFEDRYPHTLSGGQKARIACLRAILSEPDALLLDEPFSSLDPDQRNSFREFVVNNIKENKIACLLVTHDENDKIISDSEPLNLNIFQR